MRKSVFIDRFQPGPFRRMHERSTTNFLAMQKIDNLNPQMVRLSSDLATQRHKKSPTGLSDHTEAKERSSRMCSADSRLLSSTSSVRVGASSQTRRQKASVSDRTDTNPAGAFTGKDAHIRAGMHWTIESRQAPPSNHHPEDNSMQPFIET